MRTLYTVATLALTLFALSCSSKPKGKDLAKGIRTAEYESRGWFQHGRPGIRPFGLRLPREQMAVSSAYCAERFPNANDCRAYEEVDVFIALDRAESLPFLQEFARDAGRVDRVISCYDGACWMRELNQLLSECKVIRRVLISGHGQPGVLLMSPREGRTFNVITSEFLLNLLSPCALSPVAQLQFSVCLQSCREPVNDLVAGMNAVYSDPRFTPSGGGQAFAGMRLLMSTSTTIESGPLPQLLGMDMDTASSNGLGVEYTMTASGRFRQDVPTASIPSCGAEARGLNTAEAARLRRPNHWAAPHISRVDRGRMAEGDSSGSGSTAAE